MATKRIVIPKPKPATNFEQIPVAWVKDAVKPASPKPTIWLVERRTAADQ